MNPAHLHLLLNHMPVLGIIFGVLVLAVGLSRRNRTLIHLSYATFIVSGLLAIPVFLTGGEAEDEVEGKPGVTEEFIEEHEAAAKYAFYEALALGAFAIGAAYHSYRTKRNAPAIGILMLLASLFVSTVMMRTAYLGGYIRHTEIRSGAGAAEGSEQRTPVEADSH